MPENRRGGGLTHTVRCENAFCQYNVLSGVYCSHCARQRRMPWRTMSDDSATLEDVVWCRTAAFTCKLPCRAGIARCHTTSCDNWRRNWTNQVQFLELELEIELEIELDSFNFCVTVVAATHDIVRYVNSAVKSMCSCSITATLDDIVRYDTIR